jgi:hypothetical protein
MIQSDRSVDEPDRDLRPTAGKVHQRRQSDQAQRVHDLSLRHEQDAARLRRATRAVLPMCRRFDWSRLRVASDVHQRSTPS